MASLELSIKFDVQIGAMNKQMNSLEMKEQIECGNEIMNEVV